MKKILILFTLVLTCFLGSCGKTNSNNIEENHDEIPEETPEVDTTMTNTIDPSNAGFKFDESLNNYDEYLNTSSHVKVSTPLEFINAIYDAKYDYTSKYDTETGKVEQTLNKEGSVHVIEIENDLEMGYNKLSSEEKANGIATDFAGRKISQYSTYLYQSSMLKEYGITQLKVENTSNLLIFSKNGSKITHAGFKLTSCFNVEFLNLEFDEIWQWEDSNSTTPNYTVGDFDVFGWAYFKISFSSQILIKNCTFGKSYDGQIDYSNPYYTNSSTAFRAPYGATGKNGLSISNCRFNAGSDDKDGYIVKMMEEVEALYQAGSTDCMYYNTLRNAGISFEEILYGIAIPQKKGFLLGDSGDGNTDYDYNLNLGVIFNNCCFINLEDRLPKVRGGIVYLYNSIVDSSQYYQYRTILKNKNVSSILTPSKFKCALVSQGMLAGLGGSIYAENVKFMGIEQILKNNDSAPSSGKTVNGGFKIVNCFYQKAATDTPFVGSSSDANTLFVSTNTLNLNESNFSFKNESNELEIEIPFIDLDLLENELSTGTNKAGVITL